MKKACGACKESHQVLKPMHSDCQMRGSPPFGGGGGGPRPMLSVNWSIALRVKEQCFGGSKP